MGTTITQKETYWIKYQMALKGITRSDIANYAGCSCPMVSQVLHGRKRSTKVSNAIITMLGYTSFEALIARCENCGVIA